MIKKILFIAIIFSAGLSSAQSFQILDHLDNDITGTSHTETGNGLALSEIKFHVKNLTTSQKTYTSRVQRISNNTTDNLQVCFGINCYIAYDNNLAVQIIPGNSTVAAGAIDSSFKVAPFSFAWVAGNSSTWRITVYDTTNTNDSASVIVTYTVPGAISVPEITSNDVVFSAFPNPATDNLTINYSIDGNAKHSTLEVFDIVGQKVKSYILSNKKGQLYFSVNDLSAGVYFYAIKVDGKILRTERIIVK